VREGTWRHVVIRPHVMRLALGAVAPRGTCQAGGSSGGFCRGWQLLAELANEKNRLFLFAIPPIYVSGLLEYLVAA